MTHTISTKPFPGRTPAWDVYVDGRWEGVVRESPAGGFHFGGEGFIGIRKGRVYGPFPSKVEATDAVAGAVL